MPARPAAPVPDDGKSRGEPVHLSVPPAELWTDASAATAATTAAGVLRAALSILTPEGNLTVYGTAAELLAFAEAVTIAARAADPDNPARDGQCPTCDRESEAY